MDLVIVVAIVTGLFVVIAMAEPIAAAARMPATVVLALLGIGIGAAAAFFWRTDLTDALNPVALAILNLPIRSSLFLYVFLPTLIFQVALSIDLRRMLDDWVPVLVLAVVAVAVATAFVGFALAPFVTMPLVACMLVGAIVSTTDPSAVVGIFRATPAPQRLARIVEGESLLNDAAAIALFGLFFAAVAIGIDAPGPLQALVSFPWLLLGGALIGWLAGASAMAGLSRLDGHPLAQVSLTVALPYLAYILADTVAGVSGVVAVVAAGLTLNYLAPGQMAPPALAKLRDTWDLLGFWAGGLIFVLAALLIPRLMADLRAYDLILILITVVAAFAARAVILFGLLPLLTRLRVSPRVEPPYRIAILWGGLRGAVTLALALAVTESFRIAPDIRREVGIIATGFTLFTLLVQGTTLTLVIRKLGLDRLSPLDRALAAQVVAVALQSVRETVAETARGLGLPRETIRDEAKRFATRLDRAVAEADEGTDIPDRDRITLGLVALAGRERDLVLDAFRERLIPAHLANRMLTDADRIIEATRAGGRTGYRDAARKALRPSRGYRIAEWLHNRLRLSRPLARLTADRFERIVTKELILRDLHDFIDRRILRIHGRRVADLLHELLDRRMEETQKELDGLRLQFPGHAEALERRLIRQMTLLQEEREYDQLVADGLIGPELRRALAAEAELRQRSLAQRPAIDLALQKADLVAQFPLFSDMKEVPRRRLARQLRTVYAAPGEVILRRDEMPRQVWFIASGAVEAVTAGQTLRLGRGEMFGQLAVLSRKARRTQVTAITACTLLVLDEARFIELMRKHRSLRRAVEESAARRGLRIDLDSAGLGEVRQAGPQPDAADQSSDQPPDRIGPNR
ncbi:MAG: cation:proton antiporter [Gemmobacter sp.]